MSNQRLAIAKKIEEYEEKGWFDIDVNDDPPTRQLKVGEVDYKYQKLSTRFNSKIANFVAKKYFDGLIDVVYGQDINSIPKPDPNDIYKAMEKLNLKREEILFVGDSLVDYQTANNANVTAILCSYGFEKYEILRDNSNCKIINAFEDLKEYF